MTKTNIKGLPEGKYFTEFGYSQSYPWVMVAQTPCTATLREVNVEADPEWKPSFLPGGFAGHCTNQGQQTWKYAGTGPREIKIRKTKKGWSHKGSHFVEDMAREFYDYNF